MRQVHLRFLGVRYIRGPRLDPLLLHVLLRHFARAPPSALLYAVPPCACCLRLMSGPARP